MGRVIAMCIKSARNDANSDLNDDSETFPSSNICCQTFLKPESMPENRLENVSSIAFAPSVASEMNPCNPRVMPSKGSREDSSWS